MNDKSRGLYGKYYVERRYDTTGKHAECDYFVLDLVHDPHARAAIFAYAHSVERDGYQALARDLRARSYVMPAPVHRGEGEKEDEE